MLREDLIVHHHNLAMLRHAECIAAINNSNFVGRRPHGREVLPHLLERSWTGNHYSSPLRQGGEELHRLSEAGVVREQPLAARSQVFNPNLLERQEVRHSILSLGSAYVDWLCE